MTREDRINRTKVWREFCVRYAMLSGVNSDIHKELEAQRAERKAQRDALVAKGAKVMRDPFKGYIAVNA